MARLVARFSKSAPDIAAALDLRRAAFGAGERGDRHDALCRHLLVEDGNALVATCRMRRFSTPGDVADSYSAAFYDLASMTELAAPCVEVGRFAAAPGANGPDVLRVALGAIAREVRRLGGVAVFGCTSLQGSDPARYAAGFAHLRTHHVMEIGRPAMCSKKIVRFDAGTGTGRLPHGLPPLLRSYLKLGAKVSDHAVIDEDLGTLHVFTMLDLRAVPERRVRTLLTAAT